MDLQHFDRDGTPSPDGQPHQLFIYSNGQPIDVFPDHMHEGELVIPKIDPAIWPAGPKVHPVPRVVAEGTDKRYSRKLKIVTAYDGDAVKLGRIVADSSWHHYFNVNLDSFRADAPAGSNGDRIGQYYGNLAVWLAPLALRREMGELMITWVARHSLMMEEAGSGPKNIGSAAYRILLDVSSPCEVNELLVALWPAETRSMFESINLPDQEDSGRFPSKELLLGTILESYYHRVSAGAYHGGLPKVIDFEAIKNGFERAFQLLAMRAKARATNQSAVKTAQPVAPKNSDKSRLERNTAMPRRNPSLLYTVTLDRDPDNPLFYDLSFTPYDCRTTLGITSCKLRGKLNQEFTVTGSRSLNKRDKGILQLDIAFDGGRLKFVGEQTRRSEFKGAFVVLGRRGAVKKRPDPNPEEGDTGTATGSQTLRPAAKRR